MQNWLNWLLLSSEQFGDLLEINVAAAEYAGYFSPLRDGNAAGLPFTNLFQGYDFHLDR